MSENCYKTLSGQYLGDMWNIQKDHNQSLQIIFLYIIIVDALNIFCEVGGSSVIVLWFHRYVNRLRGSQDLL